MTKVAVVTGGNKGIGFAIVKGLCKSFNGHVYLTARDAQKGKQAVQDLKFVGCTPHFHELDIDDIDSIRNFRVYLETKYWGIDILVNNAAIAYKTNDPTPFAVQAEETIRTNYFGLYNVCNELFPLLRAHARVVNLSSSAGMLSNIPSEELRRKFLSPTLTVEELNALMSEFVRCAAQGTNTAKGWGQRAYSISKVGVTALTKIQQREFDDDPRQDIIVNAVHPGYVDTDMSSHKGPLSPDQGAEAPLYLALLPPDVEGPKGEMVWCDKTVVDWNT